MGVGGVDGDDPGERAGEPLREQTVGLDRVHAVAQPVHLQRGCGPEPSQADDEHILIKQPVPIQTDHVRLLALVV